MDSITVPGLGSTTTTASLSLPGALGKEDFLRLLVAQLSNQDPLAPQESTEFVAQLAQFSSLEQLMNVGDRVAALALAQTAGVGAEAVSFVGKSVTAVGDGFQLSDGTPVELATQLGGDAAKVTVKVTDASGREVATLELGPMKEGKQTFTFDGRDAQGNPLPPGQYSFRVEATDGTGAAVDATPLVRGVVEAVVYAGGAPTLRVGGREVSLGDVLEVAS